MSDEAVVAVIDALEEMEIGYMLVGAYSTNYYGTPRSTKDADFVVELGAKTIVELARRLSPQFRLDPQLAFETATITKRYNLSCVDSPFIVELFLLSSDAHDEARYHRRVRAKMLGRNVSVPTAEDVIVTKLCWAVSQRRPKDRDDVRRVIAVQRPNLDWAYIHAWCDQHGTRQLLDEILSTLPEV